MTVTNIDDSYYSSRREVVLDYKVQQHYFRRHKVTRTVKQVFFTTLILSKVVINTG